MEKLCNTNAIGDAHADKRIDTKLWRELVVGRRDDGSLGFEQAIEAFDKVGMGRQKRLIEVAEEVLQVFFGDRLRP